MAAVREANFPGEFTEIVTVMEILMPTQVEFVLALKFKKRQETTFLNSRNTGTVAG
jgi:hypothetical protein